MQVLVRVLGEDAAADTAALHRWLAADPGMRSEAEFSLAAGSREPGSMDGGLDLVNVVISNSIAAASLVVGVVATWRSSRSRPPEVHLEANGVTVRIRGADDETVRRLAGELLGPPAAVPEPGGGEE
ncbi:hypothetical protein EDD99_5791 [Streptomyces sp. 846.5]|nr:hypothetical protein [Streptomyces sp. 846.5]TDT97634.1 hypothetical protein EDD99_5791 [Streptomyces sp. 846.5]